jgi:4-hydroxybenzoate polyprenyltransferase
LFGSWIRPILTSFGLLFIISLGYAGVVNKQTFAFFTITIGGTAIHLIWQYVTVDLNDPQSCKSEGIVFPRILRLADIFFLQKISWETASWGGLS